MGGNQLNLHPKASRVPTGSGWPWKKVRAMADLEREAIEVRRNMERLRALRQAERQVASGQP
jgi:hypothetical protein